jgi:hypothetical protein
VEQRRARQREDRGIAGDADRQRERDPEAEGRVTARNPDGVSKM